MKRFFIILGISTVQLLLFIAILALIVAIIVGVCVGIGALFIFLISLTAKQFFIGLGSLLFLFVLYRLYMRNKKIYDPKKKCINNILNEDFLVD